MKPHLVDPGSAATLAHQWDLAAELIDSDSMRPTRYGMCFRYLHDLPRDVRLLELGCGEGTGLAVARSLGFTNLVGAEVSQARIDRARTRLGDEAELVLLDTARPLPFPDASFDVIVAAAVVEHVVNPRQWLADVARVLKPGGLAVISSDCWQWRLLQLLHVYRSVQPIDRAMSPIALRRHFRAAGLRLVHAEGFPLPGYEYQEVRDIWRKLRRFRPIALGVGVYEHLTRPLRRKRTAATRQRSRSSFDDRLQAALRRQPTPPGVRAYLKELLSNENVFLLRREAIT